MSEADSSTRNLFAWLRNVQADPEIAASGFRLAFVISQDLDADGRARPTQAALAAAINATERTVRTLTDKLVERGHLAVTVQRGRGVPNVYALINSDLASPDREAVA
ncbi:hypothetical protein AA309_26610 [Microvirga vignae]|uniref:Helix-turn-helix domain-containing protein n=1 Tax=Microvirga vignae TaxID=1225564 RepID=A0A0H1R537_9HYPH|nr:hypothetical protein [Microvirga vignae]KLK90305.1 hypothetical protein AA309_26610 [Microvirga vignae]